MRCGTTSLAAYLSLHPDICLARGKEAHWFDQRNVQEHGVDAERWSERFSHWDGERIVLDATPIYLFYPGALEALRRHNPDVHVVVILRDPAERARSHNAHARSEGKRIGPYWWSLLLEGYRLSPARNEVTRERNLRSASVRSRGRYASQITRLLGLFPDALVLRFDDLIERPETTVRRVTDLFGVDPIPPGTTFPWSNDRRQGRLRSPLDTLVRWTMREDMLTTERLLGWEPGTLRRARLGDRAGQRPRDRIGATKKVWSSIRPRLGRLRSRIRRVRSRRVTS